MALEAHSMKTIFPENKPPLLLLFVGRMLTADGRLNGIKTGHLASLRLLFATFTQGARRTVRCAAWSISSAWRSLVRWYASGLMIDVSTNEVGGVVRVARTFVLSNLGIGAERACHLDALGLV